MELENKGFVDERELYNVRAVAFLPGPKSRFSFGVKPTNPCCHYLFDCILTLDSRGRNKDLVDGKPNKWWEGGPFLLLSDPSGQGAFYFFFFTRFIWMGLVRRSALKAGGDESYLVGVARDRSLCGSRLVVWSKSKQAANSPSPER
jgi:hypothetical protein